MGIDDTGDLAIEQIERERAKVYGKKVDGNVSQRIDGRNGKDTRFTALLRWAWLAVGGFFLFGCERVYDKLSDINDTLNRAVVTIEIQRDQIKELKDQVNELRRDQEQLRNQVASLEGRTLRGIQEMSRAH